MTNKSKTIDETKKVYLHIIFLIRVLTSQVVREWEVFSAKFGDFFKKIIFRNIFPILYRQLSIDLTHIYLCLDWFKRLEINSAGFHENMLGGLKKGYVACHKNSFLCFF